VSWLAALAHKFVISVVCEAALAHKLVICVSWLAAFEFSVATLDKIAELSAVTLATILDSNAVTLADSIAVLANPLNWEPLYTLITPVAELYHSCPVIGLVGLVALAKFSSR
jgi:hypothetical protein